MPDPPSVNPITTYLFDSPWLAIVAMGILAAAFFLAARSRNDRRMLYAGLVAVVLGVVVFFVERAVTTSGEHAAHVARALVDAAVAGDVQGAIRLFEDDATMSLVDPRNPGVGMDVITRRLETLDGRYRIVSNDLTQLDSYSVSASRGVVHLRVVTEFSGGFGYATPSAWVIEVSRSEGGGWKVSHLTFVSYNLGQRPSNNLF